MQPTPRTDREAPVARTPPGRALAYVFALAVALLLTATVARADSLPSWNDVASKRAIVSFDGEREWAYDRASPVGELDAGLTEAARRGWAVVDMKNDWRTIYPARPQ